MHIFKKGFCLLALSLILCTEQSEANVKEGLYVGIGCGASFDQFNFIAKNVTTDFAISKSPNHTICIGRAFLGCGVTTPECVFLGAEVSTTFPKRSATLHRNGVALTNFKFINVVSVQDDVTADFLPGYRISEDCLVYARIGASYAHLTLKLEANPQAGVGEYKFHAYRYGIRAGVGINYAINDCVGIGLDYCYTGYQKMETYIELYTTRQDQRPDSHYIEASLIVQIPKYF